MADLSQMSTEQLLALYKQEQARMGGSLKINPQTQAEINGARQRAMQSANIASAAEDFLKINRQAKTGEMIGLPGVSEMMSPFSSKLASMQAITNEIAPQMRPPGSGASSDKDVAMFKRSFPNVDFPGPANSQIAARLKAKADANARYADFLEQYASENGSTRGADKAFRALQSPSPVAAPKAIPQRTASGALTPAEQAELAALKKRLNK